MSKELLAQKQSISRENGITINADKIILIDGLPYIDYLNKATIRVYIFKDSNDQEQFWFDGSEAAAAAGFKNVWTALREHCPNAVTFHEVMETLRSEEGCKLRKDRKMLTIGDLHRLFTNSPVKEIREGANDLFFGKGAIAEQITRNGVAIDEGASAEQVAWAIENKIIDYCKQGTKPGKQMQLLFRTKKISELTESVEYINNGLNGHTSKEWALGLLHDNFEDFREEYRKRPKKLFKLSEFSELSCVGEAIETKWRLFLSRSRGKQVSSAKKQNPNPV